MNWQSTTLIIVGVFALLFAWLGRYEIVSISMGGEGGSGYAYRLDRWTGEVLMLHAETAYPVKPN